MSIALGESKHFIGPNIWSSAPVTRFEVDIVPPDDHQELNADLLAGLESLLASIHELARPGARLRPPTITETQLADLLCRLAIDFQRSFAIDVQFSRARTLARPGRWEVIVEHTHPKIVLLAVRLSIIVLNDLLHETNRHPDLFKTVQTRLTSVVNASGEAPDLQAMVSAARARGIPVSTVAHLGKFAELGTGVYRRRLQGASTSLTSSLATNIARDKHLTKRCLQEAGLPVPAGIVIRTLEDAAHAVATLGFPLVVKPNDSLSGTGVFIDLRDEGEVRDCVALALEISPSKTVIVERFLAGRDFRVLVVDGEVVGITERQPAHVIGNGVNTVQELVDIANNHPSRSSGSPYGLHALVINEETLRLLRFEQMALSSIPSNGQLIRLQTDDSRRLGGAFIDRLDAIHPDNAAIARQVATVIGLDIAGIDIIATDISQSIWETDGAVLEVNDKPGLQTFLFPTEGQPRNPGPAIIDMLFPPGMPVRVPIVAIAKSPISTELAHLVARQLTSDDRTVGLAAADGLFVGGTHLRFADPAEPWAARKILNHPAVEIAVIEVDPVEILERGLAFDYCDVAVVTGESTIGLSGFPPTESVICRLVNSSGTIIVGSSFSELLNDRDSWMGEVVVIDHGSHVADRSSLFEATIEAATHCCQYAPDVR